MIRHTTLLFLLLAGGLSVALFTIKYRVQDLEQELTSLNKSIFQERQSLHVLKAEWSYLNNPQRLRDLAERYLGMVPLKSSQLATLQQIGTLRISLEGGQ
ncbi:MAG TPA: hypothetical protein ENI69_08130 [Rhodospirillales bacterium]|mgnify:CR=1 FL=1|nr:hypothetical protein [Rhodospirillales bacterium]